MRVNDEKLVQETIIISFLSKVSPLLTLGQVGIGYSVIMFMRCSSTCVNAAAMLNGSQLT